ncbi:MAG: type II toxin-antitoxin system Phd/YefM family antitoxin [Christensenellaceae bacterium]|jgi:prevent-host-death family antitoxin|nr:MAG: type II toxin-antitoxin system prevent-host-death family antitoxin [Clostridiales bacterium]
MTIDTNQVLSITETNQNFSKAARIADKQGSVVVFKNNKPKYMLINLENNPLIDLTDDEKIDVVAKRVLEKHRKAFEELAK